MFAIAQNWPSLEVILCLPLPLGGYPNNNCLQEATMKEITLTELVTDTLRQFFYGGMTADEHEEAGNMPEDIDVCLGRSGAETPDRLGSIK